MCAENIFVDELSIEPCHKTMTMTFQKGLNYLKGQNGSGKTMLLDYVAGSEMTRNNGYRGMRISFILTKTSFLQIV